MYGNVYSWATKTVSAHQAQANSTRTLAQDTAQQNKTNTRGRSTPCHPIPLHGLSLFSPFFSREIQRGSVEGIQSPKTKAQSPKQNSKFPHPHLPTPRTIPLPLPIPCPLKLQIPIERRLAERDPPALAPPHQRGDGQEEAEQHRREREPGPEVADLHREGQREVAHHEGQAAGEVEEDARLGRLRLVAVRDVGVERGGRYLEPEDTCEGGLAGSGGLKWGGGGVW